MNNSYYRKLDSFSLASIDLTQWSVNEWMINRIYVPEKYRCRGIGNELLEEVTADADAEEAVLLLEVSSYGEMNNEQLTEWYERHGFERYIDCMYRYPKIGG